MARRSLTPEQHSLMLDNLARARAKLAQLREDPEFRRRHDCNIRAGMSNPDVRARISRNCKLAHRSRTAAKAAS